MHFLRKHIAYFFLFLLGLYFLPKEMLHHCDVEPHSDFQAHCSINKICPSCEYQFDIAIVTDKVASIPSVSAYFLDSSDIIESEFTSFYTFFSNKSPPFILG